VKSRFGFAFFVASTPLLLAACGAGAKNAPAAESAPSEAAPTDSPPAQASAPSATDQAFGPAETVFLSTIPASVSQGAKSLAGQSASDADFARALRVRILVMEGYRDLGELTRRSKVPLVNGTFQLSDLSQLGTRDKPSVRDQKSSFVIDFDEPSFSAPAAELERSGKAKSASAISAFAGEYISEKTYAHSFDVASRVAEKRAGDCTEHAVFTTALLRRFGFKARVVLGIVLVGVSGGKLEPQVLAFGHAWVELHENGRWRIVDTALGQPDGDTNADRAAMSELPPDAKVRLAYLPINVLRDESASFGRALMDQTGVETIVQVDVDVAGRVK
jgi:hypothetical protein